MTRTAMTLVLAATAAAACAQVRVGVRDNEYVNVAYTFRWHGSWTPKLEQSVYGEPPKGQYLRGYLAYAHGFGPWGVVAEPYFGGVYYGSWHNMGMALGGWCAPLRRLRVEAEAVPHYDSRAGWDLCYSARLGFGCTDQVTLVGEFTDRPVYRVTDRRAQAGVRFQVSNLWVCPMVAMPLQGPTRKVKMLVSAAYTF